MAAEDEQSLERFYKEIHTKLGGSGVEVELEDEDYALALDDALRTYFTYSTNSIKRVFIFIDMEPGQQVYQLPSPVDEVREIRRSRTGLVMGRNFEPFTAAFVQSAFNISNSEAGMNLSTNLVTYEAVAQYQEQVGRMFGEIVPHQFVSATGELRIFQLPKSNETIGLDVSWRKTRSELFSDPLAYRWLRDYAEACCRIILGEKYATFGTIPSAQGGSQLKDLKTGGNDMKAKLEQDLLDFIDGGEPATIFLG